MPYDPRMLQMTRMGIGMMGPQPSYSQPASQPADPSKPDDPNAPKKPPSMFDMMMGLGRMTRPEYDKAIQSGPPGQQQGLAMVSPWAWLGSMGMPGGAGWGGGKS